MLICMISHDKYETPIGRYEHLGWQSDSDTSTCNVCQITIKPTFMFKSNKHHCRFCGKIICGSCSQNKSNKHRICDLCFEKKKELKQSVIKLSPTISFRFSTPNPIKINNNTFMFISYDHIYDTIYYYNTIQDKWSEPQQIDKKYQYSSMSRNSDAFNTKTKELYTITTKGLRKINLINKECQTIDISSVSNNHNLQDLKCIFINNEYNIIGGKKSNKHYIWDDENSRLRPKWLFNHSNILKDPELIYIETKQTLYLFGGVIRIYNCFGSSEQDKSNYIYKCHYPSTGKLNDKCIWKKLNITMPYEASNFGITSCKNDKYILLFLYKNKLSWSPEIFIFDVEKEIFTKSLVKCPIWGEEIKAFTPSDYSYKMDILLSGYFHITSESKSSDYLPQDIINLIVIFNGSDSDYVHVIGGYGSNGHWKMSIDYILKNSEEIKVEKSCDLWSYYNWS